MATAPRLVPRARGACPKPPRPVWRVVAGWLLALGLLAVIAGAGVWGLMDAIAEVQQQRDYSDARV